MRPSHRKWNLAWVGGPRSAWARARRHNAYAHAFQEPYRSEVTRLCNEIADAGVEMFGWPPRRGKPATITVFKGQPPT
jgi:hypothetical protein